MRTLIVGRLIVAAAVAAAPAALAARTSAGAASVASNSVASDSSKGGSTVEKKVCRRLQSSYSRSSEKVCLTKGEWDRIDRDAQ